MILLEYLAWYTVGLGIGLIACFFGYGLGNGYYFFNEVLYFED